MIYAVLTCGLKVVFAFWTAVFLTSKLKTKTLRRSIVFFPNLVSTVAVGITFTALLHPSKGLINGALSLFGISGIDWLGNASLALFSIIGVLRSFDLIWSMTGGGPGFATDVVASFIYKQYVAGFYGLSTAGNVIMFVLIAVLAFPLQKFLLSREVVS